MMEQGCSFAKFCSISRLMGGRDAVQMLKKALNARSIAEFFSISRSMDGLGLQT
jgi:hypothetical protein